MTTNTAATVDGPPAGLGVRDLLLDALTVSSGAVDAISFLALGKVFTAFMTGNVVFLGLRVAGSPTPPGAVNLLASIIAFAAGVYLTTRIADPSTVLGRWPRQVTLALGISVVAHGCFLVLWLSNHGQPSARVLPALLGLWGFTMGMQSAAVRALNVPAVYTTAATATVMFLAGDIANWSATRAERRRLTGVLVSLFIGAAAGALLLLHTPMYAPILPFAMTIAVIFTAVAAFWGEATATRRTGAGDA